MSWYEFKYNVKRHFIYEQKAAVMTLSYFSGSSFVRFNDNYRYDFKLFCKEEQFVTFEVKVDHVAKDRKEFFIEFQDNDKPSGIATSEKSHYYILCDELHYYLIKTSVLIELFNKYLDITETKYGTVGKLIPVQDIEANAVCCLLEQYKRKVGFVGKKLEHTLEQEVKVLVRKINSSKKNI